MLPDLPTDNLYKFLAISGLVMSAFCFYMAEKLNSGLDEAIEIHERYRHQLTDTAHKLDADPAAALPSEPPDMLKATIAVRQYDQLYTLSVVGIWFGLAAAVVGFVLWYVKTQRYQDRILRQQADEKSKSKSKPKPEHEGS